MAPPGKAPTKTLGLTGPTGTKKRNQKLGRKFDTDKLRWELLPYNELEEIVEIFTFGAQKYEDNNWKHVTPLRERYYGALMRHLTAWWCGEIKDSESGKSHLAHAGCCLLFLMWGDNNPKEIK